MKSTQFICFFTDIFLIHFLYNKLTTKKNILELHIYISNKNRTIQNSKVLYGRSSLILNHYNDKVVNIMNQEILRKMIFTAIYAIRNQKK